ncbi:CRACD-like protein isoform X1 [Pogona vitticeps]
MDSGRVPLQPPWRTVGDSSQSLFGTIAATRGRLGEAPLLWDYMCGPDHTTEADDGSREVWASPDVRSAWTTPELRVKSYKVLPELSLMDPFEAVEHESLLNKKTVVQVNDQPPSLIVAPTRGPPMAGSEPVHSDCSMTSSRTMDAKLQETEGFGEESSGKKKSKFKSIKKFFGKRKRKETLSSSGSGSLKPSQSTSDVTVSQSVHVDYDSEDELEIHRSVMGSRALSHDSIFIPEAAPEPARPVRVFSQENISDRIRALQLKLQQNWKSGFPYAFGTPAKRDDPGMNSEDDGLPRSPPEASLLQEILNSSTAKFSDSHKHLSSLSLAGTGSEEEEQVTSSPLRSCSTDSQLFPRQSSAKIITLGTSDRSLSPPADFDIPPELSSCLDNSAAKHKLLVKPRNQRCSRTRKSPSKNLPESQNDLSCTLEEDRSDRKGMLAEQTYAVSPGHQELTSSAASLDAASSEQAEMSKGLEQQTLSHQNKEGFMPHSAPSEIDSLPYGNNQEGCRIMQELAQTVSPSPSADHKEDVAALYHIPKQEEEHLEILEIPTGNLSGVSLGIISQEKNISDVSSKSHTLSHKNVLAKNDVIPTSDGTEKDMRMDGKALPEKNCNKRTIKGSPSMSNPTNPSPNSFKSTDLAYCEDSSISQTFCTDPSSQMDKPLLNLDKVKPNQEKSKSDKENHPAMPSVSILGEKAEKETGDLFALRKFSVSAACGRSRTGSLNIKETLEYDNLVTTQVLQAKMKKNSSKTTKVDMDLISFPDDKDNIQKQPFLPEPELEGPARALDRSVVVSQAQIVGSKPVPSSSSGGGPQQSSGGQPNGEDKNQFHVKLRSTSLSLKNKDSISEELKETKRHSAEFNSGKAGVPVSSSLQGEMSEVRKTVDVNINSFLSQSLKIKSKSSEQGSTKPPLPRKPIVQHFVISGTNTNTDKQEKTRCPELKYEDKDSKKKIGPLEVAEKSVPSLGIVVDTAKTTESSRIPAWITTAKQKQKVMEQELSKEEKSVAQDKTEITEKQITKKLQIEEAVKQQTDFTRSTFSSFPPKVSFEEQKKETKLDTQESLPRASLLSHHNLVQSSVTSVEKEDAKPIKKISDSSPGQPLWMELAKKKAQAWSDMPQRIK